MRWKWVRNCGLGLGVVVLAGYLAQDFIFFTFLYQGTRADWTLAQIQRDIGQIRVESRNLNRPGRPESEVEVERAKSRLVTRETELRNSCLTLAKDNPGTRAELGALYFTAAQWPDTADGQQALKTFIQVAETANLEHLGEMLETTRVAHKKGVRPVAPFFVRLAKKNATHEYAPRLLVSACSLVAPNEDATTAPEEFYEIADLIVEHHATSPKLALANFCETLRRGDWPPPWAQPFESHLRRILEVNKDRFVRCSAKIALASIVQASEESRQPESEKLFEEFLAEFDGTVRYFGSRIEEGYRESARRSLERIRSHGLGKQAPETVGVDLKGEPMTLADYRGKVVLVSFWATWCLPCMKMIPHEKELLEHFGTDRFAIVGVNGDTDIEAARSAVEQHQILWRSFRNVRDGRNEVADEWHIVAFPTFYLLDINGNVQKCWIGEPPLSDLNESIQRLINSRPSEAEDSTSTELKAVVVPSEYSPIHVAKSTPGATGFITKTHRSNGNSYKYVIFVPHNYGSSSPMPAVLFLHGSGYTGTDGRKQLTGALANAIVQRELDFPIITIFPQSHEGSWEAESPDGKRAIAILDEVSTEYAIDPSRVYLTGLSMGGTGTWSLAAAYPDRWAAIVPICGRGDLKLANRIKHIPCWCFQGEADRMTRRMQSRRMVEAIRKSGGQPLYHEYPGVGHNCWDLTYARPELYQWLLMQTSD